MQVQVVERTQQIVLQEQEVTRREKEAGGQGERYRLEQLAQTSGSSGPVTEVHLTIHLSFLFHCFHPQYSNVLFLN